MKKREKFTKLEFWLTIVCVSVLALIILGFASVYAEDFAILNNYLGDTYNEVVLIYDISGTVQDTAYKYNTNRWDTTFSGITSGLHHATFLLIDSANLAETLAFSWSYPYSSGLTLTSADYDSIAAGISAAGTGTDTIILYAVDTSATVDSTVSYTRFTIKNSSGATLLPDLNTGPDGIFTVYLDTGTYTVVSFAPGYYFPSKSLSVAGSKTDTAKGYDTDSPGTSTIYGYIRDTRNQPIFGATVSIKRAGNCAFATIDSSTTSTTMAIWDRPITVQTDTLGYWSANVINSNEYDDSTCGYYEINATYGGEKVWSSGRLYVTATNVNVSDSLVRNLGAQ